MTFTDLTIAPTTGSPIGEFENGRKIQAKLDNAKEETKKYILRGGSAGCITQYGEFIGVNPWVVLARFMGFQAKPSSQSRNMFDPGIGNEYIWDRYLAHSEYEVRCEEDYPLRVDRYPYPLTGRPDGVFGAVKDGEFVPEFGVEHKAICSTGTVSVITKQSPKTEHLIQSGVYSMNFQLPWVLVYSQHFNAYSDKASKLEFPIFWDDGRLGFVKPTQEKVLTDITTDGINDFYLAICEAYDTKDHSFFRRSEVDYQGNPCKYWDEYNSFLLMVDKDWEWSKWVEHAEAATQSNYTIELASINKQKVYTVLDVTTGAGTNFASLEAARKVLYDRVFS
jgi:hypothetical protein